MSDEPKKYILSKKSLTNLRLSPAPWAEWATSDALVKQHIERKRKQFYKEWVELMERDHEPDFSIKPINIIK